MEYGIVYLLTNPVMPGLVKIGMTTQEGIAVKDIIDAKGFICKMVGKDLCAGR